MKMTRAKNLLSKFLSATVVMKVLNRNFLKLFCISDNNNNVKAELKSLTCSEISYLSLVPCVFYKFVNQHHN